MPAKATRVEAPITTASTMVSTCISGPSAGSSQWASTFISGLSMRAPGNPMMPPMAAPTARITRGATISTGDSWMCSWVWASARLGPVKTRKYSRDM